MEFIEVVDLLERRMLDLTGDVIKDRCYISGVIDTLELLEQISEEDADQLRSLFLYFEEYEEIWGEPPFFPNEN